MKCIYAGLDIGGTNIKAALTDSKLNTICSCSIPTVTAKSGSSPEAVMKRCASVIVEMLSKHAINIKDLKGIGLGVPGIIDSLSGELLQFKVLGWMDSIYPGKILSEYLNVPVFAENDGSVNLYGELYLGAAKGFKDVILITLGTGVGGAILSNGKIVNGSSRLGGEIGHIYIDQGKTFQQYCSATAVVNAAKVLLTEYPDSILIESCGGNLSLISAKMISECAYKGDSLCLYVMDDTSRHLSYALTSLINIFNPSLILIGGGMSKAGDLLLKPAIEQALSKVHHPRLQCPIKPACLEDLAGALGSCAYAKLCSEI